MKFLSSLYRKLSFFFYKIKRKKIYKLHYWKKLTSAQQDKYFQDINPYTDWDFFKEIEDDFSSMHGNQNGIKRIFCGNVGTLGPFYAISVTIRRDSKRVSLPKKYVGFPVLRFYESQGKK